MPDHRTLNLWQAAQSISQSLQQKKIIQSSLIEIIKLFPNTRPYIFVSTYPSSNLKPFYLSKDSQHIQNKLEKNSLPGIEEWVFATGKATIMNNQIVNPALLTKHHFNSKDKIHSLALPLVVDSQLTGVVQVYRSGETLPFTEEDLQLMEKITSLIACALSNAKKLERQEQFNRELEKEIKSTTEQLRKANDELRHAELVRSESISMVAHELRTPITSISGFAKLFISGKLGNLSKEQSEFCKIIGKNTLFIDRLINDLLVLTRLELDKLEINFESINCANLIIEAVNAIKGSVHDQISRLNIALIPATLRVNGDKLRLIQVLTNLVTNAIKYAPPATPVYIDCYAENDQIIFSVDDQGVPLSEEQQTKVFDKFYRIKSSSKKSGSGLGLAICQKIITKHHGNIWASINNQGGNSFKFSLQQFHESQNLSDQAPSHSEKDYIENSSQTSA